ncbi:hypothetical protein C0Z18_15185 [Trinickia dabaoshanensis]|uniref:Uncharacterized protein n=1 Tax=Trinickia dabaoshanensis TaxID=564714 RepID=A0A2N7VPP9_9BURK|nr:hypothetical protein C0Z18_15185 [Trinickia dabaoshanensis]
MANDPQRADMRRPHVAGSPERRDSILWLRAATRRRSRSGDGRLEVTAFRPFTIVTLSVAVAAERHEQRDRESRRAG